MALIDGAEEPERLLEVEAPGVGPGWEVGMEEGVEGRDVDGRDDGQCFTFELKYYFWYNWRKSVGLQLRGSEVGSQ